MEAYNILENVINEKDSDENKSSIDELKSKLKNQIHQLKSIILQIECSLDILKFGNIKCVHSNITKCLKTDEVQDINLQLESELYRYSGFHCVKFSKQEHVFNFSPLNKYDKNNVFAVQILNDQYKGILGKWVMPMGIDLHDVICDFPIHELKNVPHFLKICKQYIDCYFIRQEQYTTLMHNISHIKNCKLQTNLGYTQINLELMGVYNKNTDSYITIIIYLLYNINETRPYKIEIDSVTENGLHKEFKNHLESSLVCFKQFDLHTAFENILDMKVFAWAKEDNEDNSLDINSLSDLETEGFLDSFTLPQRKSLILQSKKQDVKKEQKKKLSKEKKFLNISSIYKADQSSVPSQSKKQRLQNIKQSVRQQDISVIKSIPNVNNSKQKKLKQTKLKVKSNLQNDSKLQNNVNTIFSDATVLKDKQINEQLNKPFTSTPICQNEQHSSNFNLSTNIDISDIASENNLNVVGTSKLKRDQFRNHTPVKLLQRKMRKKVKSLIQSKSQNSKHNVLHNRIKKIKKSL
ncbi:uncharacterized protein LOC100644010 [Bombus terrestris]|uniref:Uncharacterized protein LOC100644010 n=1 Tax=Bombus terrestris TaxID=30195 RepID=A0A9B0C9B0_BOMTE|nr:uncharacterized protein LOC100644010 [Bombus terrestris]